MSSWYCCDCGDGPHRIRGKPICDCGHARCRSCTVEDHDSSDSCSDCGDTQSETSDVARSHLPASTTTVSLSSVDVQPASIERNTPPCFLTPEVLEALSPLRDERSIVYTPIRASLAVIGSNAFGHGHNHGGTTQRGGKDYCWWCCYCQRTWNSYNYNTHCTDCNHRLCSSCTLEPTK